VAGDGPLNFMDAVKQPKRLFSQMKKAVLREDLMAITKDITQSMVLGQMLYWTKTLDQVNQLVFEENKRLAEDSLPQCEYNYGWIWKSAREMREDLMMAFTEDSIQKAFSVLSSSGLLMKRNNPKVRYDRKLQYRVDLLFLRRKLKDFGWAMTDFILSNDFTEVKTIPYMAEWKPPIAESIPQEAETITETTNKITSQTIPPNPQMGEVSVLNGSIVNNNSSTTQIGNATSDFETFYSLYPRKISRTNAEKAWKKQKCVLSEVMPALQKQMKLWTDPQFTPHPASWLNGRRWEDETPQSIPSHQNTYKTNSNANLAQKKRNWYDICEERGEREAFKTWVTTNRPEEWCDYLPSMDTRWWIEFSDRPVEF
jgi:hypothetical protein